MSLIPNRNQPSRADFGDDPHRVKSPKCTFGFPAAVARPVTRREYEGANTDPVTKKKALDARTAEWGRLKSKTVWLIKSVREWDVVAREAREKQKKDPSYRIHMGRLFGLMVEKGAELPKNDPRRKFKYRVVFQGNRVVTQNWETALFQDMGSSPASMEAGKYVDCHGCLPGHDTEQADAEQAYVQADLEGTETWVWLPPEAWPDEWHGKYRKPVVRLVKALYGHPDSGTFWERHCDTRLQSVGFKPIHETSWSLCYHHKELNLFLVVYVDDFKLSGPKDNLTKGWTLIREKAKLSLEPEAAAHLYLGCIRSSR